MLCLHHREDRLRNADNLLPTAEGALETRPGAIQVIAGDVAEAQRWGDRIIAEKGGRIVVWDGTENDLCAAGAVLQATSFQALTENGERESRGYVADGVNPLWYVARRSGSYVREFVTNTVLDESDAPYPIPIPWTIATWRNRLWIPVGENRVQHCENDRPDEWDPLFTVECQGKNPARVMAIIDNGESLGVGLADSIWQVVGTSQYNWDKAQVLEIGVAGANAIDGDGSRIAVLSPHGVFLTDSELPVSEDLRELFRVPIGIGSILVDTRRQIVLALIAGRLFAMHLARPGQWGEVTGTRAAGLIRTGSEVGWYGSDGLWLLSGRDTADKLLDGTERAFASRYRTWPQRPNLGGSGRALTNRTIIDVQGSARGDGIYTVTARSKEGTKAFSSQFTLTDELVDVWSDDVSGGVFLAWPTEPVRRELVPRLDGESFVHSIEADCYIQIRQFDAQYRFGVEAA